MGQVKCQVRHIQGLSFVAEWPGQKLFLDAKKESGGQDLGPTPKEVLLAGILSCSGMDVASLMKKYKIVFRSFHLSAETETKKSHPAVFEDVRIRYEIIADGDPDREKIVEAVKLSMTKYCGVSAMVYKVSPLKYSVFLNGEEIGLGQAEFGI